MIDESLQMYGIKTCAEARALVRRARPRSRLDVDAAMGLASEAFKAFRHEL
jgi:hypothetical protein